VSFGITCQACEATLVPLPPPFFCSFETIFTLVLYLTSSAMPMHSAFRTTPAFFFFTPPLHLGCNSFWFLPTPCKRDPPGVHFWRKSTVSFFLRALKNPHGGHALPQPPRPLSSALRPSSRHSIFDCDEPLPQPCRPAPFPCFSIQVKGGFGTSFQTFSFPRFKGPLLVDRHCFSFFPNFAKGTQHLFYPRLPQIHGLPPVFFPPRPSGL